VGRRGALAVGHALYVDAPLSDLLQATADPAAGVPTVVAVVAAALVLARHTGGWRDRAEPDQGVLAFVAPVFTALREAQPLLRASAIFATVGGAVYAGSLAVLEAAQRLGPDDVQTAFERGHAAVDATWSGLALALLAVSLLRRHERLRASALALYAVLFAKAALFDAAALGETPRALGLKPGETITTYCQDTVLRLPAAGSAAEDRALLRQVGRRVVAGDRGR
jgi:hypothetical protein